MKNRQKHLRLALATGFVVVLAVVLIALYSPIATRKAHAQVSGDTITFYVVAGTPIVPGPTGDMVIYIGQPAGSTALPGCVLDSDLHPIQTVAAVDPGGGRATRLPGLITTSLNGASQTSPIPNGKKVGNLALKYMNNICQTPCCTSNGIQYDSYDGTVR